MYDMERSLRTLWVPLKLKTTVSCRTNKYKRTHNHFCIFKDGQNFSQLSQTWDRPLIIHPGTYIVSAASGTQSVQNASPLHTLRGPNGETRCRIIFLLQHGGPGGRHRDHGGSATLRCSGMDFVARRNM